MNRERIIKALHEILADLANETPQGQIILDNGEWPKAEANDTNHKLLKAPITVKKLDLDLEGKTVLDYGAGDGRISGELGKKCKKVVAYDIKPEKVLAAGVYTAAHTMSDVIENGPYDIILVNDVLDHYEPENPDDKETALETQHVRWLCELHDMLTAGGQLVLRCHPWISRNGAHFEDFRNMAFIHLVLSDEEYYAQSINANVPIVHQIYAPDVYYRRCLDKAGYKIDKVAQETNAVEPFISNRLYKNIRQKFPTNTEPDLDKLLAMSYITYYCS